MHRERKQKTRFAGKNRSILTLQECRIAALVSKTHCGLTHKAEQFVCKQIALVIARRNVSFQGDDDDGVPSSRPRVLCLSGGKWVTFQC